MKNKDIGFAIESTVGVEAIKAKSIITSKLPLISKKQKELQLQARFNCPCCDKGISIQIDTKI
jgi:hypothetical protein